jgi:hypothetical protein
LIYVDTNVILDIVNGSPDWLNWSAGQLASAKASGRVVTGIVVAAEVAHYAASAAQLETSFQALMIELVEADLVAAWFAGQAYREYRRRGGERPSLLPDFVIGGHAAALGATLLTRDPRRFRSYFPDLPLIAPDTDHG